MTGKKRREGLDHFHKVAKSPEETKIEVPLDIALSLLRPDELEKLKNYLAFYQEKYGKPGTEQRTENPAKQ